MLKIFASIVLVIALASTTLAASDPDPSTSKPETDAKATVTTPDPAPAKSEVQPEGKLKADMLKLVADAKAGKTGTSAPRRQQPTQSNSLSTGKKIAIVAVIAAVIITIIVIHERNHLLDGVNF